MAIKMPGCLLLGLLLLTATAWGRPPKPGKNAPIIRGHAQEVYFYPRKGGVGQAIRKLRGRFSMLRECPNGLI